MTATAFREIIAALDLVAPRNTALLPSSASAIVVAHVTHAARPGRADTTWR